jgi:5-methylcytosine-specific restriction protein A
MATYLLTWNPKRWHWDNLQEEVEKLNEQEFLIDRWSVGVSKRVKRGDRLFLIRLGKEPKGIIGSGVAESDVFEADHWDDDKYAAGVPANYVNVRFDNLLNPENEAILPRQELNSLGNMHWSSQSSGTQIPDGVANRLENLWADFLGTDRFLPTAVAEPAAIEGLLTETKVYVRGRSRQLRELALEKANGVCCVCNVDYKELLNGKGVRVLQAHHRKQLAASDAPRVTHLSDLAVVCANCHLLIHMNPRQALEVEELRTMLGKSAKD